MRVAIVIVVASLLAACAGRQDTPVLYEVRPAAGPAVVGGV